MTNLPNDHAQRVERALVALDGLSIGDALGEQFFNPDSVAKITQRSAPAGHWHTTDDTEMAVAITDVIERCGAIDQDLLAQTFALRYARDPLRGYGGGAARLLRGIIEGSAWRTLSETLFPGGGSYGNGGAMRVAPLAAYFADESDDVLIAEARVSAQVTHGHAEGQAGAIAVALACAYAWRTRNQPVDDPYGMLRWVFERTPDGLVRDGLAKALSLSIGASVGFAASVLGNGAYISAQDTVPFCLWTASQWLGDYEEAFWRTVEALGDRDTTCAIVGGIVACRVGREGLPPAWLKAREPLSRGVIPA
jgi:ADP-ribosylglycohydrolase